MFSSITCLSIAVSVMNDMRTDPMRNVFNCDSITVYLTIDINYFSNITYHHCSIVLLKLHVG